MGEIYIFKLAHDYLTGFSLERITQNTVERRCIHNKQGARVLRLAHYKHIQFYIGSNSLWNVLYTFFRMKFFKVLTKLVYMFVLGPINNNLSDMEASVYISVDRFILSALTENFFFLQKVKKN